MQAWQSSISCVQALTPEEIALVEAKLERKRARDEVRRQRNQALMESQGAAIQAERVRVAKEDLPSFGTRAWIRHPLAMFHMCVVWVCVSVSVTVLVCSVWRACVLVSVIGMCGVYVCVGVCVSGVCLCVGLRVQQDGKRCVHHGTSFRIPSSRITLWGRTETHRPGHKHTQGNTHTRAEHS
jgi:hypothetical protein